MRRLGAVALAAAALLMLGARSRPRPLLLLSLPLACHVGDDCAVQAYVDEDPGPGAHDFLCRGRTYEGSRGTEFRIPTPTRPDADVAVLASAAGRVRRVIGPTYDRRTGKLATAPTLDRECDNGVVVDDGHGWETQYCHLAPGSIRVRPGQRVRTASRLGLVGTSGDTGGAYVRLTVSKDGHMIDPFAYEAPAGSCGAGRMLWRDRITYQSGQVLTARFATRRIATPETRTGNATPAPRPTRASPTLVASVETIGLERGDIQRLAIVGPDAHVIAYADAPPLDRDRPSAVIDVAGDRPDGGWAPGIYQANYAVRRGGVDVILRTFQIAL